MTKDIRFKRGPSTGAVPTPTEGEPVYVTDTKRVQIGDGITPGGNPVAPWKLTELDDIPSSLVGQGGRHLKVNALENGIEFSETPTTTTLANAIQAEIIIVGGGGSGGGGESNPGGDGGGGGGGGGVVHEFQLLEATKVYNIVVGSGGISAGTPYAKGTNGGNSSFGSFIAYGGGAGGADQSNQDNNGSDGGCGGGAGKWYSIVSVGGKGKRGQGFSGGDCNSSTSTRGGSGGGGANEAAISLNSSSGGPGGNGYVTPFGTFGGGGGGGPCGGSERGSGGTGGGGNSATSSTAALVGAANTGGGGGGGGGHNTGYAAGASGGTGVVYIRYPDSFGPATVTGTPTYTVENGFKVYKWTQDGSIQIPGSDQATLLSLSNRKFNNLVESKVVGANCTSIEFTGLDSDIDGDYYLEASIKGLGNADLWMMLNGDSTSNYLNYKATQKIHTYGASGLTFYSDARPWVGSISLGPAILSSKIAVCDSKILVESLNSHLSSSDSLSRVETIMRMTGTKITRFSVNIAAGTNLIGAGSIFRLYKANGAQQLVPYQPTNITSRTSDYQLKAGEVVTRTFTGATAIPLGVALEEGLYELTVVCNIDGNTGSGGIMLTPNNGSPSVAAGGIDFAYLQKLSNETGTDTVGPTGGYDANNMTGFWVGDTLAVHMKAEISTFVKSKSLRVNGMYSANIGTHHWNIQATSLWRDIVTAWTSLGTLTFPVAQSGRVLIKRVL